MEEHGENGLGRGFVCVDRWWKVEFRRWLRVFLVRLFAKVIWGGEWCAELRKRCGDEW